ncbi:MULTISPECIES: sulfite exporter TauE/SafE family protein [Flavobacteriaceae]|uniref:Sulfite exporter TauE/SafE family protein n=2 Tax=Flavobacteriaceae TaxID=49546 RepID=A0A4Y8AYS3_9FLAO|nr:MULTISPECIES: sulfite exporter TauE/SafE family protein [Flavobacteriaceae]TEW76988.1 sulfite exporter TauE/SafE family protein [Gramella jeungdoensis]GGK58807.1 membrane protein [Lutibacter litoralis]
MLWTALVLGLAGSFHCIGMCGPIAFVLPVDRSSKSKLIFQTFLYHFGRIISYSLIGLLFGFIGKGLYLAGFQQRLSVLMGVVMIAIVLIPVSLFNKYNFSKPLYKTIGKVKQKLGSYLTKKSNKALFLIGFFNGFLPCGLVYMALIGSISTGNIINGAVYMAIFGIGTIPLMTGAIFLGNFVNLSLRNKIQKAIPVFVVIIGLLFILRGLGLGIPYISPSDAKLQISNNPADCITTEKVK